MKSRPWASAVLLVLATLSLPAAASIGAVPGLAAMRGKLVKLNTMSVGILQFIPNH
ncbi:hypothetical protein ACO0LB_03520 [Undibacterium sp. SXout7W]|uniref:hypothetical protein n=1 Tax=Undibacterium sp. SXout7W TaxID=3413049 RepID=UPI003BEFB932